MCNGTITNDEYQKRWDQKPVSTDTAVWSIHRNLVWYLYSDLKTHTLRGRHALSPTAHRDIAKVILLLMTDKPTLYWDQPPRPLWRSLLALFFRRKIDPDLYSEYWPFLCKADFEDAKLEPVFFAGQKDPM